MRPTVGSPPESQRRARWARYEYGLEREADQLRRGEVDVFSTHEVLLNRGSLLRTCSREGSTQIILGKRLMVLDEPWLEVAVNNPG
jgi:hypothetical protein